MNVETQPRIVANGLGGAIIVWQDQQLDSGNLYAQKVDSSGAFQWPAPGVTVCNEVGRQSLQELAPDGSGDVIVVWWDARGAGYDIYAQKIDASSAAHWGDNGVAICTETGGQFGMNEILE